MSRSRAERVRWVLTIDAPGEALIDAMQSGGAPEEPISASNGLSRARVGLAFALARYVFDIHGGGVSAGIDGNGVMTGRLRVTGRRITHAGE